MYADPGAMACLLRKCTHGCEPYVHISENQRHSGVSDHTPKGWLIMGHLPVETTSSAGRVQLRTAFRLLATSLSTADGRPAPILVAQRPPPGPRPLYIPPSPHFTWEKVT